jgi:hypothetical protein
MSYLTRTVRPSALVTAARHFDNAVRETALLKLKLNILPDVEQQSDAYNQLTLPIRLGGSGLTVMSDIMHTAYIASVAHSHEFDAKSPAELYTIANAKQSLSKQLYDQINTCIDEIKLQIPAATAKELLPKNASHFRQFGLYRPAPNASFNKFQTAQLQHKITSTIHRNKFESMLLLARNKFRYTCSIAAGNRNRSRNIDQTSARLLAVSAFGASNWLKSIPSLSSHILTDTHYQLAMRLRLGLPAFNIMKQYCGACKSSITNDQWHYLSCVKRRKNELNMRHDQVNRALALYSLHAGCVARLEPSSLSDDNGLRPDLQLIMDQYNKLVDVTIVHPTCPSHVKQAQTQLKAAHDACDTKTNKYMKLAQQQSADFVPFALESYGGISDSANDLINEISVFASEHLSAWSKEEIIDDLTSAIACAVQRGNAIAALSGYQACALSA